MVTFWNPNFQGSTPLPETRTSLLPNFCQITHLRHNFICPYQSRPFKNFKVSKTLFKLCRLIKIQKILGNTFGEARIIPPRSAITSLTRIYNLQLLFFGFGTPNVVTNYGSSRGFS